ncbi:hypothetical protein NEFER03_2248 [Nematocida sp. LUAm3]|nr:hypothetical protein NEFER03_2248 [Nematocida sp. LUAm3]KAI5179399.1 hypothetical protein NEFER01_2225 [Nematocida sp. LUAm1]
MEIILRREKRRRACIVACTWKTLAVSVVLLSMACGTGREIDNGECVNTLNNTSQSMKDINQSNSDSSGECQKEDNSECNDKSDSECSGGQKKEHEQGYGMINPLQNQGYSGKEQKSTHDIANNIEQEKKNIADALLKMFNINKPYSLNNDRMNMKDIEYLCRKITYQKSRYYIDLSDFHIHITNSKNKTSYYKSIKNIFKQIGYIRCQGVIFNCKIKMHFQLAKMFIDQIIFEDNLCIYSVHFKGGSPSDSLPISEMGCRFKLPEELKEAWKACTPIAISIGKCCQKLTEYFLNYVKSREIKILVIEDLESGLEVFDLGENKITEECPITLNGLPNTKRVVLPLTENNKYSYIKIFGIPMLQGINTKDASNSNIVVDVLRLDRQTFISMVAAYMASLKKDDTQSEGDKPATQVLEVENLHLYDMTHIFIKTEDIFLPWMKVKNVTIYIEHCDKCGISIENIVPEKCTKATFANIEIQCENDPVYESLANLAILEDKAICSQNFIKEISCVTMWLIELKCPNNGKEAVYPEPLFMNIDLNNSERIQKAIDDFQKRYSMVSIHAKYFIINIYGSKSPPSSISLIESIFKSLGPRINIDLLCFYDIKEFVEISIPTQGQDLSFITPPNKSTFIMNMLYFYKSDIGFVDNMLNSYHISGIGIYIDGEGKNKKDIEALKLEAMNKKAANIIIKEEERRKRKHTPEEPKKSLIKRSLIE